MNRVTILHLIKKLSKYLDKTKNHHDSRNVRSSMTCTQKINPDKKWDSTALLSIPEVCDDAAYHKVDLQAPEFRTNSKYFKEYDRILSKKDILSQLLSRKHEIFENKVSKTRNFVPEYFTSKSIKHSSTTDSSISLAQCKFFNFILMIKNYPFKFLVHSKNTEKLSS